MSFYSTLDIDGNMIYGSYGMYPLAQQEVDDVPHKLFDVTLSLFLFCLFVCLYIFTTYQDRIKQILSSLCLLSHIALTQVDFQKNVKQIFF